MNKYFVILRQLARAIMIIAGVGIALPLIIGSIFGIPPGKILALIASTLALQATASPVGVGLYRCDYNLRGITLIFGRIFVICK